MAYLNKATVTVDAILTKKGRELLAQGAENFRITKFAIADDEVDYRLYNVAHPLGSSYYGSVIEGMPVLEASTDETQTMKHKLVTLDTPVAGGVPPIPLVSVNLGEVNFTYDINDPNRGYEFSPSTTYGFNGSSFGYTVILSNKNLATIVIVEGVSLTTSIPTSAANSSTAQVAVGTKFRIVPKNATGNTTLTIVGNETGGTKITNLTFTEREN